MLCKLCCTDIEKELDKQQLVIDTMPTPRLHTTQSVLKKSKYLSVNVYNKEEVFSNQSVLSETGSKKSVHFDPSVRIRKKKPPRPSQELKPDDSQLF